jgi:hypothetical protein
VPRSARRSPATVAQAFERSGIRRLPASGHAQHDDSGPVPRLTCERPETGDRVRVRRRLQDAVLIIRRSPRAAWREAVDNQRGDAVPCEDVRLVGLVMAIDAAARIDDDGGRNTALNPRAIEVGRDPILPHAISLRPGEMISTSRVINHGSSGTAGE